MQIFDNTRILTLFIHPSFYNFFFFTKYSFTPHWENDQLLLDAYYTAFAEAGGPASYTKEQFESDVFIACMDAGKYSKRRERASRNGSTVVDISIPPPSFKPIALFLSRSLVF